MHRETLPKETPESVQEVVEGIDTAMYKNRGDTLHLTSSGLKERGTISLAPRRITPILDMLSDYQECDYDIERFSDSRQASWIITKDE